VKQLLTIDHQIFESVTVNVRKRWTCPTVVTVGVDAGDRNVDEWVGALDHLKCATVITKIEHFPTGCAQEEFQMSVIVNVRECRCAVAQVIDAPLDARCKWNADIFERMRVQCELRSRGGAIIAKEAHIATG
jgi:hypothetical protein